MTPMLQQISIGWGNPLFLMPKDMSQLLDALTRATTEDSGSVVPVSFRVEPAKFPIEIGGNDVPSDSPK